jgi:phage head maturation protease
MGANKMKNKTIKIPKGSLTVRAGFQPETYDADKRTIEVVFSTGSKGQRGSWDPYFEELSMKKTDVRLERLNSGAPVLNNHSRSKGLEGIIGKVEKAWIRNKQGIALIRFSEREEIQGIIRDIESGIISKVSVGYKVHKYEDVTKKGDEVPTYRATDWEPMEVSFVDIPFDNEAESRSINDNDSYECIIENSEEKTMNREQQIKEACKKAGLSDEVANTLVEREFDLSDLEGEIKRALATEEKTEETPVVETTIEVTPETEERSVETPETPETKVPEIDVDAEKERAVVLERERAKEIKTITRELGLEIEIADENIDNGVTADEFRKMAIELRANKDKKTITNNQNNEVSDMDTRELKMRGVESALLNRFKPAKYELNTEGSEFRFHKLTDLARKVLESEGVVVGGMSDNEVAKRAMHSSSDFKEILANVANKSLRDAYAEAPQTFAPFTRSIEVNDFKEISRTQLHSGAGLSKVNEAGEYEHTTMSESAEKYSLQTYGKVISLTRKTILNDDLDAFTRIPAQMGLKARALESKLVWAIVTANPTMADGNALFSAAHGNLGTAGAISVATVNEGMSKMMLQTDQDDELIDIAPEFLAGPTVQGATIKQFLGSTMPNQDGEVNPFKGDLSPIIERRLDGHSPTAWYMMASAGMIDMIEIARLAGDTGPTITTKEGFEIDGLKIKVSYDFAAKVIDHRGFFKNAGA